jgi:hypothetical protein
MKGLVVFFVSVVSSIFCYFPATVGQASGPLVLTTSTGKEANVMVSAASTNGTAAVIRVISIPGRSKTDSCSQ